MIFKVGVANWTGVAIGMATSVGVAISIHSRDEG